MVTAQKRSERLQDVPEAVSVVNQSALKANGVSDSADLNRLVPSVNIVQGGGVSQPFIRGVGNPSAAVGDESSNAVYVDGVYFARLSSAPFKPAKVDRVEILKGPQGTLFGRNAVGGLINIITKDPSAAPKANSPPPCFSNRI